MKLGGIPVLKIVAPLSILVMLFLTRETLAYPALPRSGNFAQNWWQVPAFMGMIVVVGLLVYYVSRFLRARQGVDIDLVGLRRLISIIQFGNAASIRLAQKLGEQHEQDIVTSFGRPAHLYAMALGVRA